MYVRSVPKYHIRKRGVNKLMYIGAGMKINM